MDDKMIVIGLLIIVIIVMLMYGSRSSSESHKQHQKILPGVPTPHQKILPGVPTPKEGFENYGILPDVETDVLLTTK